MAASSTSDLSESARLVIDLLAVLVRYPSVSETTNLELQGWLADRCAERGGTAHLFEGAPERANQLMRFGPATGGGLLLAGHTDVVPAGEGWSSDPWKATVADGAVFGRGTADMKAFFACTLVAIAQVDPASLQAPVHLLTSYDEEIGCVGIRDVLGTLPALVNPALVVVGEPTSMRPRHSHLGKQTYRVVVRVPEAHSSRAARCPSAITQAARLIGALDRVLAACPVSDDGDIPYSVNVGTIAGGRQTNVIAPVCEFVFEVRHDADHRPEEVLAPFIREVEEVQRLVADHGGAVILEVLNQYPALRTDERIGAFAEAVRIADSGPAVALGFGTEGGLIAGAIDAPVMVCGPGDIAVAHRPNEFVPINELERCVRFITQLVEHFCIARR